MVVYTSESIAKVMGVEVETMHYWKIYQVGSNATKFEMHFAVKKVPRFLVSVAKVAQEMKVDCDARGAKFVNSINNVFGTSTEEVNMHTITYLTSSIKNFKNKTEDMAKPWYEIDTVFVAATCIILQILILLAILTK